MGYQEVAEHLEVPRADTVGHIGKEVVGDIVELSTGGEKLKGSVSIRLSDDENEVFKQLCRRDDRSVSNGVYHLINVCYQEIGQDLLDESYRLIARIDRGVEPPVIERPINARQRTVWLKQPVYNRMRFCGWYLGYQNDTEFVENLVRGTIRRVQDQE